MGKSTQLELPINRHQEPDRNFQKGGRSFYFFDFDDNVAFLTTAIFLRHRFTSQEIQISSREFAQQSAFISKSGAYADYVIDSDARAGSFRCFRDRDLSWLERMVGRKQMFVRDLAAALGTPDLHWKGPSWNCFYHAVFNARPVALITARGHHPATIKEGIRLLVDEGHLPAEPNYLALYPVSHPDTKQQLGLPESESVPELKQRALREAVARAKQNYGDNPYHRFGMSDDDPRNIEWITREMRELKRENPQMSFFIIQTHGEHMVKLEIFADRVEDQLLPIGAQLSLFGE